MISIIIPTKNEAENLARCINSLKQQVFDKYEVIVVDNHSTDKTLTIAKQLKAKIFQAGPERSAQRNLGAQKAKYSTLLFIDADMTLEKNVLRQINRLFTSNKKIVAAIIPEISFGHNYWARVRALERSCYLENPLIEAPRAFKKSAFNNAHGYDEKIIAAEDWDLRQRINKFGQISRINAQIIHHENNLSLYHHLKKKYYYSKNVSQYANTHPRLFQSQSGLKRFIILAKNWPQFVKHPLLGLGVLILKSLEYLTFLAAKIL